MSSKTPFPPPGFDDLSSDDENEDEQALWEHMTAGPDEVPVPDWHLELLRERMARYERDGMEGISLEEFEKKLNGQLTNALKD